MSTLDIIVRKGNYSFLSDTNGTLLRNIPHNLCKASSIHRTILYTLKGKERHRQSLIASQHQQDTARVIQPILAVSFQSKKSDFGTGYMYNIPPM